MTADADSGACCDTAPAGMDGTVAGAVSKGVTRGAAAAAGFCSPAGLGGTGVTRGCKGVTMGARGVTSCLGARAAVALLLGGCSRVVVVVEGAPSVTSGCKGVISG